MLWSQVAKNQVVLIRPEINAGQTQITLRWNKAASVTTYTVYRKAPHEWNWNLMVSLTGNDTFYVDTTIQKGMVYDYYINRKIGSANTYGFISTGIQVEQVDYRGEVFIAIDSALHASLDTVLTDYYSLLVGDGWRIKQTIVYSSWTVPQLKDSIRVWHLQNPGRHHTLFLLGNIPVPYSGNLNPDAHPDHKGAWPADAYYGVFDGSWTDIGTYTDATRAENKNLPGDGKFDQSILPGEVKLQIGRVYLDKLSTFGLTRDSLYTRYLSKATAFRLNEWDVPRRAIIDDRLNELGGEYPGRNGFQNGNALFGQDSTLTNSGTYIDQLRNETWLFSHASSTGGYTSNQQLNSDMFKSPSYAVFQTSFGSYHGDWDINNNLLRAEIAGPGYGLTSVWAGRPQWHFLHMTMGYPIGFSAKITQSNFIDNQHQTYDPGYGAGWVHVALMGDPTLRLHPVYPAKNASAQSNAGGDQVEISWEASDDPDVIGYHVFRSDSLFGTWNRLTSSAVPALDFIDNKPLNGNNVYMVRALKLEEVHSGSYYNMSQGIFASAVAENGTGSIVSAQTPERLMQVYPNPASNKVVIQLHEGTTDFIQIFNSTGKMVLNMQAETQNHIDISHFAPGVYIIRAGNLQEKLVVKPE